MSALKILTVDHFKFWATFGEPVSAKELAPDGLVFCQNRRPHHEAFGLALDCNRDSMRDTQRFKSLRLDPQTRDVSIWPHFLDAEKTHNNPLNHGRQPLAGPSG